jgi:hypothetical protein
MFFIRKEKNVQMLSRRNYSLSIVFLDQFLPNTKDIAVTWRNIDLLILTLIDPRPLILLKSSLHSRVKRGKILPQRLERFQIDAERTSKKESMQFWISSDKRSMSR